MQGITSWFYGGNPDFPFTLGDEIPEFRDLTDASPIWKYYDGVSNETKEEVTIQVFAKKNAMGFRKEAALNYLSNLKKIRHPNVVKFIKSSETKDKIMIAIEKCRPLGASIEGLGDYQKLTPGFCALGLYHLLQAVDFLHGTMKSVHCNIHPPSVLVNQAGDWKLAGFELLHLQQEPPPYLQANQDLLPHRYLPVEIESKRIPLQNAIRSLPISAVDAWCVGCLMYEVFKKGRFASPREVSNIEKIPDSLRPMYKQLLRTKPELRATPGNIVKKCRYFRHPIVLAMNFLDNIALKNTEEKDKFFHTLHKKLDNIPMERCKFRILPALLHALEFGSGNNANVLASVLKIGAMLSQEENEKQIIPVVVKLFENKSRSTRINLLTNLELFIPFLSEKLVNEKIFPLVVTGFSDNAPMLRERTIRSLVHFAPKLTEKNIKEKAVPALQQLQKGDKERAIRTNSTIVFGKIAKWIPKELRTQTLVPTFLIGLKDPFPAARCAALTGLSVTLEYFEVTEVSNKILPTCCKYLIDPYKVVREAALKVVEAALEVSKNHAKLMPKEPPTVGKISEEKKPETPQGVSSALTSAGGWALSAVGWGSGKAVDGEIDVKSRMGELKVKPQGISPQNASSQQRQSNVSGQSKKKSTEVLEGVSDWSDTADSKAVEVSAGKKPSKKKKKAGAKPVVIPSNKSGSWSNSDDETWSESSSPAPVLKKRKSKSKSKPKVKAVPIRKSEPKVVTAAKSSGWDDFDFSDGKPEEKPSKPTTKKKAIKLPKKSKSPPQDVWGDLGIKPPPMKKKSPVIKSGGLDDIFKDLLNDGKKKKAKVKRRKSTGFDDLFN